MKSRITNRSDFGYVRVNWESNRKAKYFWLCPRRVTEERSEVSFRLCPRELIKESDHKARCFRLCPREAVGIDSWSEVLLAVSA